MSWNVWVRRKSSKVKKQVKKSENKNNEKLKNQKKKDERLERPLTLGSLPKQRLLSTT